MTRVQNGESYSALDGLRSRPNFSATWRMVGHSCGVPSGKKQTGKHPFWRSLTCANSRACSSVLAQSVRTPYRFDSENHVAHTPRTNHESPGVAANAHLL